MIDLTMTKKYALLGVSSLLIVSCSRGPFVSHEVTASVARRNADIAYGYDIAEEKRASDAFLELPMEAGEIISVSQRSYKNGASQQIIYRSGPGVIGENYVQVQASKVHSYSRASTEYLKERKNDLATLRRDFSREFPGHRFSVNSAPNRNGYGLFGHVYFRRSGKENCIYAWQEARSEIKKGNIFDSVKYRPVDISLRFRFCGNRMSEESAVAVIRRMKIVLDPRDLIKRDEYVWTDGKEDHSYLSESDALSAGYKSDEIEGGVQYLDQPDPVVIRHKKKVKTGSALIEDREPRIIKPEPQKRRKKEKMTSVEVPLPGMRADLDGESAMVPDPGYPKKLPELNSAKLKTDYPSAVAPSRFEANPSKEAVPLPRVDDKVRKVRMIPEPKAIKDNREFVAQAKDVSAKTIRANKNAIPLPE